MIIPGGQGNKTVDRNDFYFSALLNQMNVVNASAGYLATIAWYYSCVLSLRLLVDNTDNFTIDLKKKTITVKPYKTEPQTVLNFVNQTRFIKPIKVSL